MTLPFDADTPRPRGASTLKPWLRALELTAPLADQPHRTLPVVVAEWAERRAEAPALLSDRDGDLTFGALARLSNRWSRWALARNIGPGEVVGLLMPNRPVFVAIWLGITRVGGTVALLNTSLVGAPLAHCIAEADPGHVIVDQGLEQAYADAARVRPLRARVWRWGTEDSGDGATDDRPLRPDEAPPVTLADRALLIYTSGTTGLPKAAVVSHRRILTWSFWFAGLAGIGPEDRMYDCLPLFHSVGGVVAIGSVLVAGGSVVVAERFSARTFWDDLTRRGCTLFQYIGELPRYLLKAAPSPAEARHRLRLALGNGLSAEVWTAFQKRFRVPAILEFYAATEGNFSLFNVEGKVGAIGRTPPFLAHRFPAAIVRFDPERGLPERTAEGLCVRCPRNETGEAIGLIHDAASRLSGAFEGYTSAAESEKKVLRDVFKAGDAWFRTGDLMRMDEAGFYYFVDRIGDTFRWKGENVSTSEVTEALRAGPGIRDAAVYAVAVPGADGRAGMAALVTEEAFSATALYDHLAATLPAYARPLFLRLCASLDATDTFKRKTGTLARDGFDPGVVADPLLVVDAAARTFVPLDGARFTRIATGLERF